MNNLEKSNKRAKDWAAAHPDICKLRSRKCNLLKKYGISIEDYNKLFESQNGCCAICGINRLLLSKELYVDHCHSTGKVRGLLCRECNFMLGYAKDKISILEAGITYLKKQNLTTP